MIGFNIREENHIPKSILFGFPTNGDDAIVINYNILYAKYYIYLDKIKDNNKKNSFNVDFFGGTCAIPNTPSQ